MFGDILFPLEAEGKHRKRRVVSGPVEQVHNVQGTMGTSHTREMVEDEYSKDAVKPV